MLPNRRALSVNFVTDEHRSMHGRTLVAAVCFTVVVGLASALGGWASYRAAESGTGVLAAIGQWPVLSDITRLVYAASGDDLLAKLPDGRMNVLLLGIGGEGHDGPQLTDSMMLATLDLKTKRIALLSIPRDLAYPAAPGQFEKINAVNAYAEAQHPGEGARLTAEAVAKLFDIRIDHVVRVDFRAFTAFVDALGGVDVNVERSFIDPQFGDAWDNGWMTVSFKKGWQHMDGETALNFTRSRHGTNGEAGDIARGRRQQLVLLAIRDKLLSLKVLTDPTRLANLYEAVTSHIQTDLTPWEILQLAPLAQNFSPELVSMRALSDDPQSGQLVDAMVDGNFLFFPRKPDWSEIRQIAQNPFDTQDQLLAQNKPAEHVSIEIKNGTLRTGFAAQVAGRLEKIGYDVPALSNASYRAYEQTVIFDLTGGQKPTELARLRKLLNAEVSVSTPVATKTGRVIYGNRLSPETIVSQNPDFLIILGDQSYALIDSIK